MGRFSGTLDSINTATTPSRGAWSLAQRVRLLWVHLPQLLKLLQPWAQLPALVKSVCALHQNLLGALYHLHWRTKANNSRRTMTEKGSSLMIRAKPSQKYNKGVKWRTLMEKLIVDTWASIWWQIIGGGSSTLKTLSGTSLTAYAFLCSTSTRA